MNNQQNDKQLQFVLVSVISALITTIASCIIAVWLHDINLIWLGVACFILLQFVLILSEETL